MHSETTELYVHVPRTAGTSLRTAVIQKHGASRTFVYSTADDRLIRADRGIFRPDNPFHVALARHAPKNTIRVGLKLRDVLALKNEDVFLQATAIIGHFAVDRFDDTIDPERFSRRAVVREPLARMISHYCYLLQNGMSKSPRGWMNSQNIDMPFTDFALSEPLQNFQTRYTGIDASLYDVLGTTERFSDFLFAADLIQDKTVYVPHLNPNSHQVREAIMPSLDQGFVDDFQQFHASDYNFYQAACERTD